MQTDVALESRGRPSTHGFDSRGWDQGSSSGCGADPEGMRGKQLRAEMAATAHRTQLGGEPGSGHSLPPFRDEQRLVSSGIGPPLQVAKHRRKGTKGSISPNNRYGDGMLSRFRVLKVKRI